MATQALVEFLTDLQHGPCATTDLAAYAKWVSTQATEELQAIAVTKLQAAGAYGRTMRRWFDGFYGRYTVADTAAMTPDQILAILSRSY